MFSLFNMCIKNLEGAVYFKNMIKVPNKEIPNIAKL